jgi:hypothetical protein
VLLKIPASDYKYNLPFVPQLATVSPTKEYMITDGQRASPASATGKKTHHLVRLSFHYGRQRMRGTTANSRAKLTYLELLERH